MSSEPAGMRLNADDRRALTAITYLMSRRARIWDPERECWVTIWDKDESVDRMPGSAG